MLSRRDFIFALSALTTSLASRRARGLGEREKVALGQLVLAGGNTRPRPSALRRLLWEVDKRTLIAVRFEPELVRPVDAEIYRLPFLYLAGDGACAAPSSEEIVALRRHLQAGGFLLADSADGRSGPGSFDHALRLLARSLFPDEPLAPLPPDHVIYQSFYLLKGAPGRLATAPGLEAVNHDGRSVIVYSQNDLGGAWARDALGQWEYEARPGGEPQREMAFRVGVNLLMYATCLDYKTDQVHVPFILRRRRWQAP